MHCALTFKSDYFDPLLCTYRHTYASTAFTTLPGLSEMLFTKQEKGQENQANQQKSLSSPKKRTIVLPEADCSDRDIEDSEVGKSRSICIPIPLLPLPNAFAALLLWEQMAGMCLSQRLWHHPRPGTALSASLTAAPLQQNPCNPTMVEPGQGHRAQLSGWALEWKGQQVNRHLVRRSQVENSKL